MQAPSSSMVHAMEMQCLGLEHLLVDTATNKYHTHYIFEIVCGSVLNSFPRCDKNLSNDLSNDILCMIC